MRKVGADGAVNTLAGDSAYPNLSVGITVDGTGRAASFADVRGIAAGADGTLYVADGSAANLRRITPDGVVTTLAGSGLPGSAGGTGAAASFASPSGLVMDKQGTLFMADFGNHRIRKITPGGSVSTLSGTGQPGTAGGPAAAATFNRPSHMAADDAGQLFVYDVGSRSIRTISPAGIVSTLAGGTEGEPADGKGAAAVFNSVGGMAVGPDGVLYVSDFRTVRMVSADGTVSTLAGAAERGGNTDGALPAARFNALGGIAIASDGRIFVADYGNHTVRVINGSRVTVSAPATIATPAPTPAPMAPAAAPHCQATPCATAVPGPKPIKAAP